MAKVFYVVDYNEGEGGVDFFKTENEAIAYGKEQSDDFQMSNDLEGKDGSGTYGGMLTFKKGILFSYEESGTKIQAIEDADARKYALDLEDEFGSAVFFEGFKKGNYCYLSGGADGQGIKWSFTGDGIDESVSNSTLRHVPTFEQFNSSDFLEMQASSQGMTREEWIAHYGTSTAGVDEKNEDGTISPDEDERLEGLLADVRFMTNELIDHIAKEAEEIGGYFRAPGMEADCKKLIKEIMKKRKFKF